MSKKSNNSNPSKRSEALKRLSEDLAIISTQSVVGTVDEDMLSLIVNEILLGEDISRQHPTLYQKLLENAALREAVLDALVSIEAERAGELIPLPNLPNALPAFLRRQHSTQPFVEVFDIGNWRATWKKTAQELQTLFSPPELAYRSDSSLTEDPWFTFLRGELRVEERTYTVVLEGTTTNESEDVLSVFLMLAVTSTDKSRQASFPLQASLNWGTYSANMLINEEGRIRFPDVLVKTLVDPEGKTRSELSLMIKNAA